jgi:lipoyl(octanoyl) transferase
VVFASRVSVCRKLLRPRPSASLRRFSSVAADESSTCNKASSSFPAHIKIHSSLEHGCIDYARSWAWQQTLLSRRLDAKRHNTDDDSTDEEADCIVFLEHHPVYTLGRGADETHLTFLQDTAKCQEIRQKLSRKARGAGTARLAVDRRMDEESLLQRPMEETVDRLAELATPVSAPNGVPIFRVDRGGEVTFHGPSQLVVYPNFDLRRAPFKQDLHWYLRMVEEVVIQTLGQFDIEGVRDEINTGVWVGTDKVAAVGVSSSRWITTHGFALNVSPDLSYFDTSIITPCGIAGRGVTSIAKVMTERGDTNIPDLQQVAGVVVKAMEEVFQVQFEQGSTLR